MDFHMASSISTDKDINSALYYSMDQAQHHGPWAQHRSQTSTWPPGHGSQTPIWSPTRTSILPLVTAHTTDTLWPSEEACYTDINMAQVASQIIHIYMALGDNTGHRHQHQPWLKQDHILHIASGSTGYVHQHDLWQQPRPQRISWPSVVEQTTDVIRAWGSIRDHGYNMASRGSMGRGGLLRMSNPENEPFFILDIDLIDQSLLSHLPPLYVSSSSSSASPHGARSAWFLHRSHLSIAYSFLRVALGTSVCHTMYFSYAHSLQGVTSLVQGFWFAKHHKYRTITETHLWYPAVAWSCGYTEVRLGVGTGLGSVRALGSFTPPCPGLHAGSPEARQDPPLCL